MQEQEITELRFSLNDTNVTADLLDADKRQLKQKNKELEQKFSHSSAVINKLRNDIRRERDLLREAEDRAATYKQDAEKAQQKALEEHKILLDARKTMNEIRTQLDNSQKELREATVLSMEKSRQADENGKLIAIHRIKKE